MTDLEALHNELRRTHVLVRTNGEWVAYRPGRRGRWDGWRAIQMLGGLDSPRVGTRSVAVEVGRQRALDQLVSNTFPAEWGEA